MKRIETLEGLIGLCSGAEHIKLYGAGLRLASFMEIVREMNIPLAPESILVSAAKGNPETAFGIPVVAVQEAAFHDTDVILLTISECFTANVEQMLAKCGMAENCYEIDYKMIDSIPYQKVYEAVEPFVRDKLWLQGSFNQPVKTEKRYVWTCWWQGETAAPELVKACWRSQRRYLPKDTEHVIITWDNFKDYVELPDRVVEMAQKGEIILAHLADMVRCCLLYRYGGIWLDATVYMTAPLPEMCFTHEIWTRSTGEKIYCTNSFWVTWFLGGKQGEELYRFIMEAFFYYLKDHDKVYHYYMIDFLIAIACTEIAGIEEKFNKIPVNNRNATELQKHLRETFDEELYRNCTEDTFLQKLTYKGNGYGGNSIYCYLMEKDRESEKGNT